MSGTKSALAIIARRAMLERGLQPAFGDAVLHELAQLAPTAHVFDPNIRDLRGLLWVSIDNDDSRDLDQLSVAEASEDGTVKVLVAIADVDALVQPHGAIDAHAQSNTTSVYTAAVVFPMLPERLSTDLTSLCEGQERLALVVEMVVDAAGRVGRSEVYRALVVNRAKLAYNGVAAWLDGGTASAPAKIGAAPGLAELLRLQDVTARAMRKRRLQNGALSLDTIEPRSVFEGEALKGLRVEESNRAKDLIEDFMIAANGVVAEFLEAKGFPALRRVLRAPERWGRIVELAAGFEHRLPAEPDARALDAFLAARRAADPLRFPDVSLSVVKLLGKGEYALKVPGQACTGHFALAVANYTHATAPNRRFADLLIQRLLKAAVVGGAPPYNQAELAALAKHCTEQESNAARVERQVRKSAAALLVSSRLGEHFSGVITGASAKGTWIRIFAPIIEGRVVAGFEGLDVGDKVDVILTHTDAERGFIDFVRA